MPEGAATDVDFQRAIQQLEDQQHGRAGWLFARGAMDKGDQAYLNDQEERRRHAEEASLDRERAEFMAARVRVVEEESRQAMRTETNSAQTTNAGKVGPALHKER